MFIRLASAALAAVFLTGSLATDALADHQYKRRLLAHDRYYAGRDVVRVPGVLRLIFGGYRMTPDDYAELYGEDNFDESYYDPQLDEPVLRPKPRKAAKTAKPMTPVAAPKKQLTTASIAKPAATGTAVEKPASASALSCAKAGDVITGYGFSAVKASDCTGAVYAFNATRDGKPFAIKLNAASGELTEVKKLQ